MLNFSVGFCCSFALVITWANRALRNFTFSLWEKVGMRAHAAFTLTPYPSGRGSEYDNSLYNQPQAFSFTDRRDPKKK